MIQPRRKRPMAELERKLRQLRTERKVGMKRLAHDFGVSHTYISHIERGKSQPSESLIRKFAAYFGVDEEDLLPAAGKFPHDIEEILNERPREVVMVLRESFASYKQASHT